MGQPRLRIARPLPFHPCPGCDKPVGGQERKSGGPRGLCRLCKGWDEALQDVQAKRDLWDAKRAEYEQLAADAREHCHALKQQHLALMQQHQQYLQFRSSTRAAA